MPSQAIFRHTEPKKAQSFDLFLKTGPRKAAGWIVFSLVDYKTRTWFPNKVTTT
jgi:hypothetical protein